jgi:hypothetical protein
MMAFSLIVKCWRVTTSRSVTFSVGVLRLPLLDFASEELLSCEELRKLLFGDRKECDDTPGPYFGDLFRSGLCEVVNVVPLEGTGGGLKPRNGTLDG